MLDFLFSTEPSMAGTLTAALRSVAVDPDRPSHIFSGYWGCLATAGRAYPCFDPVETDRHVVAVLGGPLPRHDFTVATASAGDDGTRWILDQWKAKRKLRWDEDLVGHFAVLYVDKSLGHVEAVTDINSFVPIYTTTLADDRRVSLLGSHVDGLALAAGRIICPDEVSVGDFMTYGTITYPHTLYRGVSQLPPAGVHRLANAAVSTDSYWTPLERQPPVTFEEHAGVLRETLVQNVRRICSGQERAGLLMSGGEDARAVASAAANVTQVEAITVVDSFNREARIASQAAECIGSMEWQPVMREPDHYILRSAESVLLSESQNFFLHAHINGFSHHLPARSRVLGGLMADAFWKGSHIQGVRRFGIQLSADRNAWEYCRCDSVHLPHAIAERLSERRNSRNSSLLAMRPVSWAEWHSLTPASMNHNLAYLFINRRLFPCYEPFVDAAMVRLSASTPQSWKLNRRLTHAAIKPLLGATRYVPHSRGFYPYWGMAVNAPIRILWGLHQRVLSAAYRLTGSSKPNPGPWPVWNDLAESDAYRQRTADLIGRQRVVDSSALWARIAKWTSGGKATQRFRALQLLEWANWRSRVARSN